MFEIIQKHQNVVENGLKCQDVVNPELVYQIEVVTKLRKCADKYKTCASIELTN